MNEKARIEAVYAKRSDRLYSYFSSSHYFMTVMRNKAVLNSLKRAGFKDLGKIRILEVGCGRGNWILDFLQWGASPECISALDILEKRAAKLGNLMELPLLDKESIRIDPKGFLDERLHPWPKLLFHTSGSTGTPIHTYWRVCELRNSLALREVRSANWAGVSFTMPRATCSGRMVEPDPHSKGPFYRFNCAEKQVYFSAFHLRSDTDFFQRFLTDIS